MDEDTYKRELVAALSNDFNIESEVPGVSPIYNAPVVIDFISYPKEHLIANGFEPLFFGIEVKSPDGAKGSIKKCIDAMWQAHSYTLASFGERHLGFVLLYPPPSVFFSGTNIENELRHTIESCMQRGNVGRLDISDGHWRISFSTSGYYNSKRGKNAVTNLGTVRWIGGRKVNLPREYFQSRKTES